MKKVLLNIGLLIALGLQTQAQCNYCDSIKINIVDQPIYLSNDDGGHSGYTYEIDFITNTPKFNIPGNVNYLWELYMMDGTAVDPDLSPHLDEETYSNPSFYIPLTNNDSVFVCLTTEIIIEGKRVFCYICDTMVWDGVQWTLLFAIKEN